MSNILVFEKLDESTTSGVVAEILIKVGDEVKEGDILLEIETDKAVVEIPSKKTGVVSKILVKSGQTIKPGDGYIEIEEKQSKSGDIKASETKVDDSQDSSKENSTKSEEGEISEEQQQKSGSEKLSIDKVKQDKTEIKTENGSEAKQDIASDKPTDFLIPELGDNIEEATINQILIKENDNFDKNSIVAELETDKATFELPSTVSGIVNKILFKEGDNVKTGDVLFKYTINKTESVANKSQLSKEKLDIKSEEKLKPLEREPEISNDVKEKVGTKGMDYNTNKVIPSMADVNAPPSVRRFAREVGIDLHIVTGTGINNRITIDDVKEKTKEIVSAIKQSSTTTKTISPNLPDFSQFGKIEKLKINAIKRSTANAMNRAWQNIPMVTNFEKVDITKLEALRKKNKIAFEKKGIKLTMTAIIIKFIAHLLKIYPSFNSSFDSNSNEIILKKYINIGIAVDTPNGLIVPVLKGADAKNIEQIAKDLDVYSKKARDKKVTMDDISGATFTISNLGGIGGNNFTPIVNWPEVAILGVSRSKYEPVYNGKTFEPKLILPISLSYDHRVIDGAQAARFLKHLVSVLEEPFNLLLNG